MNGWIGIVDDYEYYPYHYNYSSPLYCVLIIAEENVNDLLVYPMSKNSFVQFFGYGWYRKSTPERNATSRASFKGSIYYLKYYIRFTVKIKYDNSGSSQEYDSLAYGIRNVTDVDKGTIIYEIIVPNTQNKNIIDIISNNDFEFSDNNVLYSAIGIKIYMVDSNNNFTNTGDLYVPMFDIISKDISSDYFSIDFNVSKKLVIENQHKAFLGYYTLDNLEKEEIECSLENKTDILRIICNPKNIIYTYYSSMIMKIPQIKSSGKSRLLQTKENSTFYASTNGEEYMDYEYNPVIKTFSKKMKQSNGLSAGAIIAIIFSVIAVITVVVIAIYFLNKPKIITPSAKVKDVIQNSTANIIK